MNPGFIVRSTQQADISPIGAIYGEAVLHGTASYELEPPSEAEMRRRWRELADRNFPHLVAVRDGIVAGFAYAGPYRPRPGYRYLVEDSVYVTPSLQRSGIGRALLGSIIHICEAAGFRQMVAVIGAGTEHPGSVGLHKALGFRQIGVIEASGFKHGRWLDTVLMQRPLGPGSTTLPET
jgi:phosphinothricin acetyltransferase